MQLSVVLVLLIISFAVEYSIFYTSNYLHSSISIFTIHCGSDAFESICSIMTSELKTETTVFLQASEFLYFLVLLHFISCFIKMTSLIFPISYFMKTLLKLKLYDTQREIKLKILEFDDIYSVPIDDYVGFALEHSRPVSQQKPCYCCLISLIAYVALAAGLLGLP